MKKSELVAEVAKRSGLTQKDVNVVVDVMSEVIREAVVDNHDEVNLPAIGKFKVRINNAKKGINPMTKEPIDIKESHTIAFKASSAVKKVIEPKAKKK